MNQRFPLIEIVSCCRTEICNVKNNMDKINGFSNECEHENTSADLIHIDMHNNYESVNYGMQNK